MKYSSKIFEIYSFYNLSRYLFLKIEKTYNSIVLKSGITLPQLRVLWSINTYPGICSNEIAIIGCWSRPTVSNILKKLIEKNLIIVDSSSNNKMKKITITRTGIKYINLNMQEKGHEFPLFDILNSFNVGELRILNDAYKYFMNKSNNSFILEYIEKINKTSLEIDFESFKLCEKDFLKHIICLYNCLRIFILTIENNHNVLLKKFDLTYPQLRALKIIKAFEAITSVELSEIAIWSPSTANLIVKNLYNKNLIEKKRGNIKNYLHLYITDKGSSIINDDISLNNKKIEMLNLVDDFTTEEIRTLNKLLYRLNSCLHNDMVKDYILKSYKPTLVNSVLNPIDKF